MPDSDKDTVAKSGAFGGRSVYGPLLVLLKAEKLAVLVSESRFRVNVGGEEIQGGDIVVKKRSWERQLLLK